MSTPSVTGQHIPDHFVLVGDLDGPCTVMCAACVFIDGAVGLRYRPRADCERWALAHAGEHHPGQRPMTDAEYAVAMERAYDWLAVLP